MIMSKRPPIGIKKISTKEMMDAIQGSGYLVEQRVEQIIMKEGYYVETNPAFPDPDTGKSREFDISALSMKRLYKKSFSFIFPNLLCECENNSQPIVFFTKDSPIASLHHYEVKVSGLPVKFWTKDGYIGFSDFTKMEKFHHYCKAEVATQYCTFFPPKGEKPWIAHHGDEQHDTLNTLIKVLEYKIADHYADWDDWVLPRRAAEEEINIQVYYPLLILQGDLYSATSTKRGVSFKKVKQIQFRKESFLPKSNKSENYQIDVITEDYLQDFLKIVESEMEKVIKVFKRKRKEVLKSIEKIVKELKALKKKPKSYREYLEF
jgi:hypothetical protein